MNMQLAQQTLSFAQQDFANKQASMQLISSIAMNQAQLQQQAALAKQYIAPSDYTQGGIYDPITGQIDPLNVMGYTGNISSGIDLGIPMSQIQDVASNFSSVENPWYRQNDPTMGVSANRNNPGNIKDPKTGEFRYFDTFQDGWNALINQIEGNKTNYNGVRYNPNMTLTEYFDVYDEKGK